MKLWDRTICFCRCFSIRTLQLNISSTVRRPALTGSESYNSSSSALDFKWLRIIRNQAGVDYCSIISLVGISAVTVSTLLANQFPNQLA